MKKVYILILNLLFIGGWAFSQNPTSWSDNFDDNDLDTVSWKVDTTGAYNLVEANGELTITVTKDGPWNGFHLKFPNKLDLSENPYASFKIKADTALDFRIYLWDENPGASDPAADTLYNRSNADVWVVPGDTYYTYYFNWSGKFLHDTNTADDTFADDPIEMDSTDIEGFLINVEPGAGDSIIGYYQGTVKFEDFKIGVGADLPTAEAELTSTSIGSIGATVLSDIPEQTTAKDVLDGLTANGEITLYAAGNPGKAGTEAADADIMDPTMKIVVILDGSNPKKYNVLVAPPALPCYYREDFPTVDAEIDPVWETVPVYDMPHVWGTVEGPTDFGAKFRTLWDEVSLFFLVEVTDDIEFVDNVSDSPWGDDAVEFWLDLNNSKNSAYLPSETDEYQFIFSKGVTNTYMLHKHDLVEGLDWAWANTQTGYIFEIEIPWLTSLEWKDRFGTLMPDFGHKMGFEIHVNDDDDGADREANIGWFYEEDQAWTDPSTLGDMKMMEEIYESVQQVISDLKFRMHPNPAIESLQLISNTDISNIKVINLTGQTVMDIQVNNERLVTLDIKELSSSIYMVTVRDKHNKFSTQKFIKK
ncbi:MAG: T9SS type A sorting domain-containing protein [Bacteroidales bacterium]|nr:T9SS type A sorting domain-containing protein [Bacteroidales bacterium]